MSTQGLYFGSFLKEHAQDGWTDEPLFWFFFKREMDKRNRNCLIGSTLTLFEEFFYDFIISLVAGGGFDAEMAENLDDTVLLKAHVLQ